jgi:hypothetical protein
VGLRTSFSPDHRQNRHLLKTLKVKVTQGHCLTLLITRCITDNDFDIAYWITVWHRIGTCMCSELVHFYPNISDRMFKYWLYPVCILIVFIYHNLLSIRLQQLWRRNRYQITVTSSELHECCCTDLAKIVFLARPDAFQLYGLGLHLNRQWYFFALARILVTWTWNGGHARCNGPAN